MRVIELTQGMVAIVDDEDFIYIAQWRWHFGARGYAVRGFCKDGVWRKIYMHREILKPGDDAETDHKNGNKMDNRRCNLRPANRGQQNHNKGAQKNNKLGMKGVCRRPSGKFVAQIGFNNENINLGLFTTAEEAKEAHDKAALKLYGVFARN